MKTSFACACLSLIALISFAQQDLNLPTKPLAERVEEAVKPAKDEFLKAKASAIDRYKKALDAELEKATSRGSLEDVKAIKKEQDELAASEDQWKIPKVVRKYCK